MAGNYCCSPRSLRAMVFSWACRWRLLCSCSGDFVGDGIRQEEISPVDTEALRDLLIIFLFVEGLCEIWLGQLFPCILCVCESICIFVRFSYIVIYIVRTCDKKKGKENARFWTLFAADLAIYSGGPWWENKRGSSGLISYLICIFINFNH
jgi:hypothetical protein